jgi:hypothetical protein
VDAFHHGDLIFRQPVKTVDDQVNQTVGGGEALLDG